jgi:acetylornithine/N-succinyldiaminopimelate aminotransferase
MTHTTPRTRKPAQPPPSLELLEVKTDEGHGHSVEKVGKAGIVGFTMDSRSLNDKAEGLLGSAQKHLYPNYAQPQLVMDHGEGSQLWDTSGKRYLDFFGGIAVSTLGHAHPRLITSIREQAEKLLHLSNYFYTEPNIRLAETLCALTNMDRAFFCNSGTEANEAALKLARRYFYDRGQEQRDFVVAFDGSFHGRTLGSLTATGQQKYRTGFGPIGGVFHGPFGDLDAARALVTDRVAAIIVEPFLGEGGVIPAPEGFLRGLRDLCNDTGTLLILDEIQTGVGRTGTFLACEQVGVAPDILTLAKGLGGGVPIGAMLTTEALSSALPPGSHGTTFGGNPLASAAALCVLRVLCDEGLVERTNVLGEIFERRLQQLAQKHPCVSNQRGKGLLQALVVTDPSQGPLMLEALRKAGLLVTFAGGTALRFTPPLTISEGELDEGLRILDRVLGDFS